MFYRVLRFLSYEMLEWTSNATLSIHNPQTLKPELRLQDSG